MTDVIDFTKYKQKQSHNDGRLTPELLKEYKDTIGLVLAYQDELGIEDWKTSFMMCLHFNHIILRELEEIL